MKHNANLILIFISLLTFVISLSGCKIELDSNSDTSSESNSCSGCYITSPDIYSCKECKKQSWTKKKNETCEQARRRNYGTTYGLCPESESYNENKHRYAGSIKLENILLASNSEILPKGLVSSNQELISTSYSSKNCDVECKKNTSFCMLITKSNKGALTYDIKKLHDLFSENHDVLIKTDLMNAFDVSDDPCQRGDTYTSNGYLQNSGVSCVFAIKADVSGLTENISFQMPDEIRGNFNRTPELLFSFSHKSEAPYIKFDSYLNEDFGGYVATMLLSSSRMLIGTEKGCILITEQN